MDVGKIQRDSCARDHRAPHNSVTVTLELIESIGLRHELARLNRQLENATYADDGSRRRNRLMSPCDGSRCHNFPTSHRRRTGVQRADFSSAWTVGELPGIATILVAERGNGAGTPQQKRCT